MLKTSTWTLRNRWLPGLTAATMAGAVLLAAGTGLAQPAITYIDSMTVNALSSNGRIAGGLSSADGLYEACRWTPAEGVVRLGSSSVAAIGRGGGLVGMSNDGNQLSSTIISSDSLATQGRWTKGVGWEETMPPVPADGGNLDEAYGSAWDLSGDGSTVVGLYWRPFNTGDGSAHASKWTAGGGLVDLGSQGSDSRANGVNDDGSVIVGWASLANGTWQPTVWEDSGMTVLTPSILFCEAWGVNGAGTIIVGDTVDTTTFAYDLQVAALWQKTPTGWDEYKLGALPGTQANGTGHCTGMDVNDDGSLVVGINAFSWLNFTGFVWTANEGLMKADDWVASLGITLPAGFSIQALTCISADGRSVGGYGKNPAQWQLPYQGVIISLDGLSAVPDLPATSVATLTGIHPNPFNPATSLALDIARGGTYRVEIFDVQGMLVRVIHDGVLAAGRHDLVWDGHDDAGRAAASGVYYGRVQGMSGAASTRAMTLLK